MKNPFLILASLFGATGVTLGALGAHYLKGKFELGIINEFQYDAFDKATKYQLMHAIVLLFVFFFYQQTNAKLVKISGWLFVIGILFFSGSVYALSTQPISHINFSFFGPVTPLGGLLLIAGWVCLLIQAFRMHKNSIRS
ncbi:MAG TPA: DUF423 domain-containing protein [Bacteroidia bacterium]|jgi:uncharacterized membrane protein YgdD (TMEM256/DUF423 family)|nr:DUF423 domain-containing protein [Bacteroidia bacterium]